MVAMLFYRTFNIAVGVVLLITQLLWGIVKVNYRKVVEFMNILHMVKLFDRKATGIRTVVPSYIYEQAKYENVFLQNVTNFKIECEEYQLDFASDGWPFNIKDKQGRAFVPDIVIFHGFYLIEMVKLAKIFYKNKIP